MSDNHPTRREALLGLAAAPLIEGAAEAPDAAPAVCFMSAVEIARLIRTKKLSAREALAAHLKQIERVNPKVNAIVTLVAEMAAADAAKADEAQARRETLGPLHGLPVAHKDLLETAGVRRSQVDRVFLTGGSSLVPAVRRIFKQRFGEDRIRTGDEFISVARGLAMRAQEALAVSR